MSGCGTFPTCRGGPSMSVHRGRPEVAEPWSNDAIDPEQKSMQTLPRKMLSRATGPLGSSFNVAADFTSSSERRTLPLAPAPWS